MKTVITMHNAERVVLPSETRTDARLRRSPTGRTVLAPTGQAFDAVASVRNERNRQARKAVHAKLKAP